MVQKTTDKRKTISLDPDVKERLDRLGRIDQKYSDVIRELLDVGEEKLKAERRKND